MNKTIYLLGFFSIISCSDKLSEKTAKKLFEECDIKAKTSGYNNVAIPTKIVEAMGFSDYKNYRKFQYLAADLIRYDYIKIDTLKEKALYDKTVYNITITNKLRPYIVKEKDKRHSEVAQIVKLIPEEIISIHEYPSFNTAEVKFKVKGEWLLPELKEKPIFENRTSTTNLNISYTKANNGWILCK